jgi:hypothetical protein
LDRLTVAWFRRSGMAGIAGFIAYAIGDVLLLGNTATAVAFPYLTKYADNLLVRRSAAFVASSTARLGAGAVVGLVGGPLILAGVWHIFQACKPGGTRWSVPPFLLLFVSFTAAPFIHGSFFYVAEILKTASQADGPAQTALLALATRAGVLLLVAYGVAVVPGLIGFVWLTTAIARGKAMYPRWVALANPVACVVVAALLARALPQPLARWLSGAGLSLGFMGFFALSTIVLWNPPLSRAADAQ